MRDIRKTIADYDKQFGNVSTNRGKFFASDLQQLKDISLDTYDCLYNALRVGYMAGYRLGLKEAKERKTIRGL